MVSRDYADEYSGARCCSDQGNPVKISMKM